MTIILAFYAAFCAAFMVGYLSNLFSDVSIRWYWAIAVSLILILFSYALVPMLIGEMVYRLTNK